MNMKVCWPYMFKCYFVLTRHCSSSVHLLDIPEKPWESASSHPVLPLEMGGAINKQKAPASTILWGEGKESWDIAGPTHLEKEEVGEEILVLSQKNCLCFQ